MSQQPALPKRPKSPFTSQLDEVKAAFPDVDASVARAVVVAAAGNLENAFNGLLALSDETIRPPPPQEVQSERTRQLARDEQLARELASGRRRQQPLPPRPAEDDDISIDEIRDNLQKWGNEASKNIGSFFNNIKQRIQEIGPEEVDEDYYGRVDPHGPGASRGEAYRQVRNQRKNSDGFLDEQAPPKPKRPTDKPVNAFGEDKPARWEPLRQTTDSDAFFIGESDEDVEDDDNGKITFEDEDEPIAKSKAEPSADAKAAATKAASAKAEAAEEVKEKVKAKQGDSDAKTEIDDKLDDKVEAAAADDKDKEAEEVKEAVKDAKEDKDAEKSTKDKA